MSDSPVNPLGDNLPHPDRNNPRPLPPEESPERVHRVADPTRPEGGPFGPPKKKRPSPWQSGGGGQGGGGGNRNFGPPRSGPPRQNFGPRPYSPAGPSGGHSPNRAGPPRQDPFAPVGAMYRNPAGAAPGQRPPNSKLPAAPSSFTATDWSDVAEWYDRLVGDEGSEFHREVVLPGTLRLLGDVADRKILDVACGQGVLSRLLQIRGADVTAIDASDELIAAARARGPESIRYLVGDAKVLPGIPTADPAGGGGGAAAGFDAAACVLAIQNIHPPQNVFTAVARALKPGGAFVIVMMHPAFRSPKSSHWGWEPNEKIQFRRVDKYLTPRKEPITTHPGKAAHGVDTSYTWTFHRPIADYVRFFRNAGLMIDGLEEWISHKVSDSGPRAPAENLARREIPMFLALRGVKVGPLPQTAPEDRPTEQDDLLDDAAGGDPTPTEPIAPESSPTDDSHHVEPEASADDI